MSSTCFASVGMERISSSEDDVSSVSSNQDSAPESPPPEDSRCKLEATTRYTKIAFVLAKSVRYFKLVSRVLFHSLVFTAKRRSKLLTKILILLATKHVSACIRRKSPSLGAHKMNGIFGESRSSLTVLVMI